MLLNVLDDGRGDKGNRQSGGDSGAEVAGGDLEGMAGADIGVTVLCPAFVPTGIFDSHRNRPIELREERQLTPSQEAAQRAGEKAVQSGRLSADDVAHSTFEAIRARRFYLLTHPKILPSVELRMRDILEQRNPSDPFSYKPDVAAKAS